MLVCCLFVLFNSILVVPWCIEECSDEPTLRCKTKDLGFGLELDVGLVSLVWFLSVIG